MITIAQKQYEFIIPKERVKKVSQTRCVKLTPAEILQELANQFLDAAGESTDNFTGHWEPSPPLPPCHVFNLNGVEVVFKNNKYYACCVTKSGTDSFFKLNRFITTYNYLKKKKYSKPNL